MSEVFVFIYVHIEMKQLLVGIGGDQMEFG
jgi:hypothetical protein